MLCHATLITADGAYHCPVGSIMAIFMIVIVVKLAKQNCRIFHQIFSLTFPRPSCSSSMARSFTMFSCFTFSSTYNNEGKGKDSLHHQSTLFSSGMHHLNSTDLELPHLDLLWPHVRQLVESLHLIKCKSHRCTVTKIQSRFLNLDHSNNSPIEFFKA